MNARLNLMASPIAAKTMKHVIAAGKALADSTLPFATQELVKLRASQINGCAGCIDMHTKEAAAGGETSVRLNLVAAWREATVFTEAERAALELTEQGTRIADAAGGVTDAAWANAAKHYDEEQLAALVCAIALINAFNRGTSSPSSPPATTRSASSDSEEWRSCRVRWLSAPRAVGDVGWGEMPGVSRGSGSGVPQEACRGRVPAHTGSSASGLSPSSGGDRSAPSPMPPPGRARAGRWRPAPCGWGDERSPTDRVGGGGMAVLGGGDCAAPGHSPRRRRPHWARTSSVVVTVATRARVWRIISGV